MMQTVRRGSDDVQYIDSKPLEHVAAGLPVRQPMLKYMKPIFGANILMTKPNDAVTVPTITVTRNPSLLQRTLAIGPEQVFKSITTDYRGYR